MTNLQCVSQPINIGYEHRSEGIGMHPGIHSAQMNAHVAAQPLHLTCSGFHDCTATWYVSSLRL